MDAPSIHRSLPGQICRLAWAGIATLALAALPARADELSELKALLQVMNERLSALEAKSNAEKAVAAAPSAAAAPVAKALTVDQNGAAVDSKGAGVTLYTTNTTSLRIYGLLEATLSDVNHQTDTGGRASGFQTAWFSGNRLGFDADHALALGDEIGLPGLKVISKLETEFELPTGDMDTANVFFNRDAWLGFYSEDLGKITLGRQNTLTRDFTQNWGDPYGTSEVSLREGGYSNVNNFKQFIFYSAGATGTRLNSAVEWKKKFADHWVAGLAYAFGSAGAGGSGDVGNGGATPGDFSNGTTQQASIAYNGLVVGPGKLNANLSYDHAKVAGLSHESALIGGNFVTGRFRFNTGYAHYTAQQGINNSIGKRTDNAWTTSVSFTPGGRTEFALGFQELRGDHAGFNGGGKTLNPFGNTSGVTLVANGAKSTVYGSIVFHADRQLDLYVAADQFRVKGDWVLGDAQGNGMLFGGANPYRSELEAAIGARFKF